jgi:L-aminopeptidase/D-esterase-like protein
MVDVDSPRKPRARDLGIPFDGTPGPQNAITDVAGVAVGHVTVAPPTDLPPEHHHWVRTGVTAILPRSQSDPRPTFAGWFSLNGNGELTGTTWLEESGFLDGPILSTNTNSVGVVRDAAVGWAHDHGLPSERWTLPVVGETWDGYLNDVWGFHVRREHALAALNGARPKRPQEGNVGGGTGMMCYGFKGGIGTASRRLSDLHDYTVATLVQANHGLRNQLIVSGVPVGRYLPRTPPETRESGSILAFVATDAPLLPHQLKRLARRCALGLARSGSTSGNGSGDLFLAFSTANTEVATGATLRSAALLSNESLDPIFEAVVQSTDEAIVNALVAAETMVGFHDHRADALPHDRVVEMMEQRRRFG